MSQIKRQFRGWGARIRTWEWRNQNPGFAFPINDHSEKSANFEPRRINRLDADSECAVRPAEAVVLPISSTVPPRPHRRAIQRRDAHQRIVEMVDDPHASERNDPSVLPAGGASGVAATAAAERPSVT